ncbi:MAG: hypothetical protein GYA24_01285 [Candidatus Lokiarchaeota archaeon]|nr:hypothetical protein [Candidatus Lokiarchaeota archaeon]
MHMRKTTTAIIGLAFMSLFLAVMIAGPVVQAAVPEVAIGTNLSTQHMNAGETTAFRFRAHVRLQFNTTSDLTLNMDVDADAIGDKEIAIDLDCATDCELNMTCRQSAAELGLQNGNTIQTRSRNRYQVNYGFMANISCNCTVFTARLRAQVGNVNGYTWAYYNEAMSAWEEVPTTTVNGEAIAQVTHFSTWTLLAPEQTIGIESVGLLVAIAAAAGLMGVLIKKRRAIH